MGGNCTGLLLCLFGLELRFLSRSYIGDAWQLIWRGRLQLIGRNANCYGALLLAAQGENGPTIFGTPGPCRVGRFYGLLISCVAKRFFGVGPRNGVVGRVRIERRDVLLGGHISLALVEKCLQGLCPIGRGFALVRFLGTYGGARHYNFSTTQQAWGDWGFVFMCFGIGTLWGLLIVGNFYGPFRLGGTGVAIFRGFSTPFL